MKNNYKIGIIGLGYVGLPLAIEFGKKYDVKGFDINKTRIKNLTCFNDKTKEISESNFKKAKFLTFTNNLDKLKGCNVFIITVPTPVDKTNRPNLSYLENASKYVARILKKDDIVIYESTVYPGATEEFCIPILSKYSRLKFNEDFFCGYSPERINPGDKIYTLTKVRKITSGSNDKTSLIVDKLYKSIIKAGTFKVSSIKVAEAAKVIENSQRDLNIAFVNELSVIFQRLKLDTLEVLEAAGSKWNFLPFRPGMVGGHCIGVDPYYLTYKAEEVGYNPQVILAGRRLNDNMARYAARNLVKIMLKNKIDMSSCVVGVLGVTFKENCPDIRNSKIFDLINELRSWGIKFKVMDSWASKSEVKKEFKLNLTTIENFKNLDALVVAVGHSEYRKLKPFQLKKFFNKLNKPILADLKSLYDKYECEKEGFTVFRL